MIFHLGVQNFSANFLPIIKQKIGWKILEALMKIPPTLLSGQFSPVTAAKGVKLATASIH